MVFFFTLISFIFLFFGIAPYFLEIKTRLNMIYSFLCGSFLVFNISMLQFIYTGSLFSIRSVYAADFLIIIGIYGLFKRLSRHTFSWVDYAVSLSFTGFIFLTLFTDYVVRKIDIINEPLTLFSSGVSIDHGFLYLGVLPLIGFVFFRIIFCAF